MRGFASDPLATIREREFKSFYMSKIIEHFTPEYNFEKLRIDFVTLCGIVQSRHKRYIHATIIEKRVNCKSCNKILRKKLLNEVPVEPKEKIQS